MTASANIFERGVDGVVIEKPIPASQPGDTFPAGAIIDYAGSAAPSGWMICDGSAISRAGFPTLFANIGTTYGAGDGSTTFNIPDCRGRQTVGKAGAGTFLNLGATGGAETSALGIANMPAHNHGGATGSGTSGAAAPSVNYDFNSVQLVSDIGSGSGTHLWGTAGSAVTRWTPGTISVSSHTHSVPALSISSQGSGTAFNTTDPYIVLNKIIRAY